MPISRRQLLHRLSTGSAAALAAPWWTEAESFGPTAASIRLNRNENAYGPSERALDAIRHTTMSAHRYTDVEAETLQRVIAQFHRVAPDQVVPGCGSAEVIRMAVDAFTGPKKKLIVAAPTFDRPIEAARRSGATIVAVPLTQNYAHDLPAMLAHCDAHAGLVYVCNPNNPTGTLTPRRDLEAFIRRLTQTTGVVIDEAYHDYVGESSDYASFIERPLEDPRMIVTRSFSKIHGLAGLRIGYAVAAPQTARLLRDQRLPDDINVVAAAAAVAALDDVGHTRASASRNVDDRQEFYNQANARMLRWIDSQTNFVWLNTGGLAVEVIAHLKRHECLVAAIPAFTKSIRVSLGTPGDMRQFWRVWDLMPGHRMSM
jgi:histidinol-phosphate aminotransferase